MQVMLPYRSLVCNHMYTSFYSFDPKYSLFRIVVAAQRHGDLVEKDEELSIDGLEALQQKAAKQKDVDNKSELPSKFVEQKVADPKVEE